MDVSEHPLDRTIRPFADALEEWLGKWGRRLTQVLWKEYQNRPRGFRRFLGSKQASVLDDEELWREIVDSGYGLVFPFINEAGYIGLAASEEMLLNIGVAVDFDLVNPVIAELALRNTFDLVRIDGPMSFVASTRAQLRRLMARMYAMPDLTPDGFMAALEHLFGRGRAEMIAVTEMTNIYADAGLETAKIMGRELGLRMGYEVLTVGDPDVCGLCQEVAAGGPYPIEDEEHKPALHPRCRCDWKPIVLGEL